jgi:hypothetical protein
VNEDPETVRLEIVTVAVPVSESVMVCFAVCPTVTLPKLTEVELTVRVDVEGFSFRENAVEAPFDVAVREAV